MQSMWVQNQHLARACSTTSHDHAAELYTTVKTTFAFITSQYDMHIHSTDAGNSSPVTTVRWNRSQQQPFTCHMMPAYSYRIFPSRQSSSTSSRYQRHMPYHHWSTIMSREPLDISIRDMKFGDSKQYIRISIKATRICFNTVWFPFVITLDYEMPMMHAQKTRWRRGIAVPTSYRFCRR